MLNSNTWATSSVVVFKDGRIEIDPFGRPQDHKILKIDEVIGVKRSEKDKAQQMDMNIFKYVFYMGAQFAFLFELAKGLIPSNRKKIEFKISLSGDRWMRCISDMDTFFAIQDAYLDFKYSKKDMV